MRVSKKRLTSMISAATLLTAVGLPVVTQAASAPVVQVQVHNGVAATLSATPWGINTEVNDSAILDSNIPGLLKAIGVKTLRIPGGTESDVYHWKTNSITLGGGNYGVDFRLTFDALMGIMKQTGVQPIITVNYGTNADGTGGGDPKEAAAWVKYANVTKKYNAQYWEIGNEVYGNGTYGNGWEPDLHKEKGPDAYAKNASVFIKDMKAADKNIKVGVVLTCPGSWPDGQSPDWNSTVLQAVGSKIDFVVVHWYAFSSPASDSDLLSSTDSIPAMASQLQSEIQQYCGSNAKHVQILLTETNAAANEPNAQSTSIVNALFLANDYMGWLENGIDNIDWWDLHGGASTGGGAYGILDSMENKYPTYYAMAMLHLFARPKDQLLQVTSNNPAVHVYVSHRWNGTQNVLVVNTDPSKAYQVKLSLPGIVAQPAKVYTYGKQTARIVDTQENVTGSTISQTVQPYSMTVISLKR